MNAAEIEAILMEDQCEGAAYGEICVTKSAAATCEAIIRVIAPRSLYCRNFRWAVFGEDGGIVVLALRSQITRRRVDFRIAEDGQRISCISIDEHASATSVPVSPADSNTLQKKVAWLFGDENE